jgi:hypothetical protein
MGGNVGESFPWTLSVYFNGSTGVKPINATVKFILWLTQCYRTGHRLQPITKFQCNCFI